MMGPRNYYITHLTKQIRKGGVYEVTIEDPKHRLFGLRELIYLVRDEDHLKKVCSEFDCIDTGYFDQKMFDMFYYNHCYTSSLC